jgi:hypothetical protein
MEHFLTEKTLCEFSLEHIDSEGICDKVFPDSRFRPDFRSERTKLIIEFDGYSHYTNSKTIIRDREKDLLFRKSGYRVIRIPYFIQLDEKVMRDLFSEYVCSFRFTEYPHGFHDKKAVLPADFCSLGVQRFKTDLTRFSYVKYPILKSLLAKRKHMPDEAIFPLECISLLCD